MFLRYYGLREQPFGVTPDPRFLYLSAVHREALASLMYGIDAGLGFSALIADPGMGKTTLLYCLLARFQRTARTAFIFETQCTSHELLRSLLSELEIGNADGDSTDLMARLKEFLLAQNRIRRQVIVVLDEAQNLDDSVLETVRLLSNFETPQAKLLHIVLSGQRQLAHKLAGPDLAQLRQRIAIVNSLPPFASVDVVNYAAHRLKVAGYAGPPLFTPEALGLLIARSRGIPREINRLCFNAMSLGCAVQKRVIDQEIMDEVASELDIRHLVEDNFAPLETPRPQEKLCPDELAVQFASAFAPPNTKTSAAQVPEHEPDLAGSEVDDSNELEPAPEIRAAAATEALPLSEQQQQDTLSALHAQRRVSREKQRLTTAAAVVAALVALVMLGMAIWLGSTRWQVATNAVQAQPTEPASAAAEVQPVSEGPEVHDTSGAQADQQSGPDGVANPSVVQKPATVAAPAHTRRTTPAHDRKAKRALVAPRNVSTRTASPGAPANSVTTDRTGAPLPPVKWDSGPGGLPSLATNSSADSASNTSPAQNSSALPVQSNKAGAPVSEAPAAVNDYRPAAVSQPEPQPSDAVPITEPKISSNTNAEMTEPAPPPAEPSSPADIADSAPSPVPAPVASAEARPVSHLTPGKLIKRVDPVYPSAGRAFGLQGKVVLDARIGKDGRVQDVRVVQGPAVLRRAAIDAVRQWVYQPWLLNGEPQELQTTVVVRFTQPR